MLTQRRNLLLILTVLFLAFRAVSAQQDLPGKVFNVMDYGAVPDGTSLCTEAIQRAVDAAFDSGGGQVILPEGIFLSGSIILKSNVSLFIDQQATLLGSTDPFQYKGFNNWKALVLADNASHISILGQGIIDGQGRQLALNVDSLHHIGEVIDPNYNYRRMRPNEGQRPQLIYMMQCEKVKVEGVTLRNSSCWVQTYEQCADLELDRITVLSRAYWNNDGMDVVDCRNVRITRCDVNSADDGICLKSHSASHLCEDIYIADCTVRSSASGLKFGTASYGGFKNVVIENIRMFDTFRSAIAIESVDGGIIENISVSDIVAVNTGNAIFIRLGHRSGEKPGSVKDISISNMYVQVPFGRPDLGYDMRGPEVDFFHNPFPASIAGIPGHEVENVKIEGVEISYPGRASRGMAYLPLSRLNQVPEQEGNYPEFSMFGELPAWGLYVRHARNIELDQVAFRLEESDFRPAFVYDDVTGLVMKNIDLPAGKTHQIVFRSVTEAALDETASGQVKTVIDPGESE